MLDAPHMFRVQVGAKARRFGCIGKRSIPCEDTAPTGTASRPSSCHAVGQDYSCDRWSPWQGSYFGPCGADKAVQKTFVLPPSGDVTVDVSLGGAPSVDAAADQKVDDAYAGE